MKLDPAGSVKKHTKPWHTLDISNVEELLGTSARGLDAREIEARLGRYGPNALAEAPPPSPLAILLHQFRSPLIYILLAAAVVTLLLGEYIDSGVIGAVLALNAVIGFVQEYRAEHSVRALMQLISPRARVIREGREREVESRELVPGDLVLLESGVRVPADLRLISTTALVVDESLLTGESVPVVKKTSPLDAADLPLGDRTNMAYAGSIVASGRARGYVVSTGAHTELGTIAEHVRGKERAETPLQTRIARFAGVVGIVVAVGAIAVFALGIARGESVVEMFMVAVAMAVAVVPEGLPVVFTVTLALGVRRMARRNAIIRRLPAVETLGSTTVIGSDKTGTLTENRMTVQKIWAGGRTFSVSDGGSRESATILEKHEGTNLAEHRPLYLTLLTGVLTNEADILLTKGGYEVRGDPTEAALLIAAAQLGIEPAETRSAYPIDAEIPFESERQYSASFRSRDGEHFLFVKGAPERLSAMSDTILMDDGPITLEREVVLAASQALASEGLRVLGMAYRVVRHPPSAPENLPAPEGLTFLGLQGSMDPPRQGVREAIAGCQESGIRVVMITGDHAVTARAIGKEIGIVTGDAPVLTGMDLMRMDDAELRGHVQETSIYARVAPEHKLRVVQALQSHGEVVAVTGDGVNDAPALKAAAVISIIVVMQIMSEVGINLAPLLAAAGIGGLAIGFGAQTLIKDLISGFFLLIENQIRIGDVVNIGGNGGLVESMGFRTLTLRDLGGSVHIIPNGTVDRVINMTRDYSRYVFDVRVSYREDPDEVIAILNQLGEEIRNDSEYGPDILEPLEMLGLDKFEDSTVIIKCRITTKPIKQWRVGREFNRRLKKEFDRRGIEIPFPHPTIYMGEPKLGRPMPLHIVVDQNGAIGEHRNRPPSGAERAGDRP